MKICSPSCANLISWTPFSQNQEKHNRTSKEIEKDEKKDDIWMKVKEEASMQVQQDSILSDYYFSSILSHNSLGSALANQLSIKLSNSSIPMDTLFDIFFGVFNEDEEIMTAIEDDLRAVKQRDPACTTYIHCFLNFKGFLACQALALLIQNRMSEVLQVDIHPGAKFGSGIFLDHATGIVMEESVVIGNDVSILHNVTIGGSGKEIRDRHPKIGDGVLIGAVTNVLGNVEIGERTKIGAGAVVQKEVPPRTSAVENPARLVGGKANPIRLDHVPSLSMDHTSHIVE
ncbi:serine acetyltransferase 1, chloroplastic-like [Fagus crenata]